jgi:hypothetical protein
MSNPYQAPQFPDNMAPQAAGAGVDREKLRRVARYQQWVLYSLLANIAFNVGAMGLRGQGNSAIAIGIFAAALIIIVLTMVSIALLASELYNVGIAVLCAILMIVPCVSLITLLIVNGKATTFLQQHGIKVGFMGTNPDTI